MHIAIFKSLQIRINTGFVQNVHFLCDILKLAYREFTFIFAQFAHLPFFLSQKVVVHFRYIR